VNENNLVNSYKGKILIVAGFGGSLIRFRGDLIISWLKMGYIVTAAAPGREVENQLRDLGVDYYCIPLNRTGLNPFKDIRLLINLTRLYAKVKPDYIFLYTIKPVIFGSLAAFYYRRAQVYAMITGLGYIFNDSGRMRLLLKQVVIWLYRIALTFNKMVFFQNPDDIRVFEELRIVKPDKIMQINGSGVNVEYFSPAPLPGGQVVFLLIARLLREKGINEYIEAAGIIKAKYPDTRFRLVGWAFDDNPSAISHQQVENWRSEKMVEIYSETADVRPFIAESSVYVLPSYRGEGTPRTVLEAMAMGRAIITTDAPGCRETVIEGINGYLVPVKDSQTLAKVMERFILEPELINIMGAESRKIAEEKYDVHKVNAIINRTMRLG
jgi:glycosyltransferase involved in cell wall biosynthesis